MSNPSIPAPIQQSSPSPSEHLAAVLAAVRASEAQITRLPPSRRRKAERIRRRWETVARTWTAAGLIPRMTPPRRAQRRTPRRAATTSATKSSAGDDDGGDGDPDPPSIARVGIAPIIVTDARHGAAVLLAALGLTSRQLRELVDEHQIQHARRHPTARHIHVRVSDVLAALGLGETVPRVEAPTEPEQSSVDEATIIELAARRRS